MTQRLAVDASALIAILNREPEQAILSDALIDTEVIIGAPSLLEVDIWVRLRSNLEVPWLADWLNLETTKVVSFDRQLEQVAARAYQRFGKGLHEARLNFGDCMAYAVATRHGVPLLFKGEDFGKTDVAIHPSSVVSLS